jgi:RNA polymerase subunit RPABC4/transcription elongation factor Spt4
MPGNGISITLHREIRQVEDHALAWQSSPGDKITSNEALMTLDPTLISNLILVLTGFGGAFLAALWISLVIWTYRDVRTRARDPLVQTLATLLVAVLNLPGVLVYLILRPPRTLEEEYQRTLEEEALLQALEDLPLCPGCERHIKDDWQVCPNCHTKLKKTCENCNRLVELPWNICPYCGTPAAGMRRDVSASVDDALRGLKLNDEPGELKTE